jgi:hypothetical protein
MLDRAFAHQFAFGAVRMPLNIMDALYNSFEKKVLPVLVTHNIALLGMSPMGDSAQQDGLSRRMSAPCHEPADPCGDHWLQSLPERIEEGHGEEESSAVAQSSEKYRTRDTGQNKTRLTDPPMMKVRGLP